MPKQFPSLHAERDALDPPRLDNTSRVLICNSPKPEIAPCSHLVHITLEIWCDAVEDEEWDDWGMSVAWKSPLIAELDPRNLIGELLDGLEADYEHEEFRPTAQHEFKAIDTKWKGFDRSGQPDRFFRVYGWATFAESIPAFIQSLFESQARLDDALRAGRNTRHEWAEAKLRKAQERDERHRRAMEYLIPDLRKVLRETQQRLRAQQSSKNNE